MQNLKIKNSVPVQENFMGNGAVYHGYAGMNDDAGRIYTDEQCRIEAKRAADMRLKIARTAYEYRWMWNQETEQWDWESHDMKALYRWLTRMKEADIDVALQAGWCSPADIWGTSWNGKCPFAVEGDYEKSCENYADWISESIHQLIELRGFTNIKYFVVFTEPNRGFGNTEAWETWKVPVLALDKKLKADGRRAMVKLMGPNEGSGIKSDMCEWVSKDADLWNIIDVYSSHAYQNEAGIPKKYIRTGSTAMTFSLAGGRMSRQIKLKPNTEYEGYADLLFYDSTNTENPQGAVSFGVFANDAKLEGDIHTPNGCGPTGALAEGSVVKISPEMLKTEYQRFKISFNSGDNDKGVVGIFHDVTTPGLVSADILYVLEKGSNENIVPNGDMENGYDGWYHPFAGGLKDPYDFWYKLAKTGLQYVPQGKEYCVDEYNILYDRENSRISHGAEIVNAAVALMNAGVNSSLMWTVFDQQWPSNHTNNGDSFYDGDHRCGVMSVLTRTLVPHKSFYAFTLLSRYVDGNGTKVYEGIGNDCLHTTLSVSKDGYITVVVVNCKDVDDEFEIDFEKPLNATLYRHTFDPEKVEPNKYAEVIGIDKTFENVSDKIKDTIPAYGVKVYTTHLD